MSNGIASAFLVSALIVPVGGCEFGVASPPAPDPAVNATESPPPRARYGVDPGRNRVWFLTRDGVSVYDVAKSQRILVPLPSWLRVDMPYGRLPDLALGPGGEAVITSNVVPTLWRIDPETLAVSVHPLLLDSDRDKEVGFSGLVYSPEHEAFFAVSDVHGSLWRIDRGLERARKIWLSAPVSNAFGLAVLPRILRRQIARQAALCAFTPQGGRTIDFEPGQRSAYVRAAPCADRGRA
ncbi:MAG TPA: hypothetical protein VLV56_13340 [Burkholderiales bacterium]|nr:hypothetical protein [Burkholderiales bacterium]